MFPLRRSSSFSAYSYESDDDDDENDNDPDCWCLCDDENDDDITESEEQHSKDGEIAVNETTFLVADNKTSPTNHSRPYQRRKSKSRLMVLGSMCVLIVVTIILQPDVRTREENMASVSILGQTRTTKSTTTNYGEVWLIRHGEKDDASPVNDTMRTMYELNGKGWDRAHHLVSLVQERGWPPKFSALVASRPPTEQEANEAYPDFARDESGQSMVWREYQTLMPLAKHLAVSIAASYTKGQVEAAGLDIAQKAVGLTRNQSLDNSSTSPIVLVSWDHCSLPTLVVHGLGCRNDPRCYRCWGDDRFGDVLKLNVTLMTTTTTTPIETTESRIVHRDYHISSTILSMKGEAYPGDDYHVLDKSSSSSSSSDDISLDATTRMSIEESTPCKKSYCTKRAAAKDLVSCTCWDSAGKPRKLLLPSETIGQSD